MRLTFSDRTQAQFVADRIFASMQAADALEPGTTAWAIPAQDEAGAWFVTVDERCRAFLTAEEVAQVPEWKESWKPFS
jgi:hypothetical protein